jgi:hypothetical protein
LVTPKIAGWPFQCPWETLVSTGIWTPVFVTTGTGQHFTDNSAGLIPALGRMNQENRLAEEFIHGITEAVGNGGIGMNSIPLGHQLQERLIPAQRILDLPGIS